VVDINSSYTITKLESGDDWIEYTVAVITTTAYSIQPTPLFSCSVIYAAALISMKTSIIITSALKRPMKKRKKTNFFITKEKRTHKYLIHIYMTKNTIPFFQV
jgi:hypothetical protein